MSAAGFLPLVLTAASARTSVGDDVEETCASIRARIVRLREHPFYRSIAADGPGEPLVTGRVDGVDPAAVGAERLITLLLPVLEDVLRRGDVSPFELSRTALLLSLPAPDEAVEGWKLDEGFFDVLGRRAAVSFGHTGLSRSGHSGVLELCAEASALLMSGAVDACVVAGVDSYLSADRMALLDGRYRLKSKRNVDGFFPGEAAAALLFESEARLHKRGAAVLARIAAVGVADEPETCAGERPSSGRGLCGALRAALGAEKASWVLCDLNGESYRGFEWGIASARLGESFSPSNKLVFPAISTGDIGAAAGALLVGMVSEAFRRGYAPSGEAIVWTSSDGPRRAAVRVQRP